MTTERCRWIWIALVCAALGAGCVLGVGKRGGLSDARVAVLPAEVATSYRLFAQRCSRCHNLSRPLNAGITEDEHWRSYVSRMRRNPGSGISPNDGKQILVFLSHWASEKRKLRSRDGDTP